MSKLASDVLNSVSEILNDPGAPTAWTSGNLTSGTFWTGTELLQYLNDGYSILSKRSGFSRKMELIPLIPQPTAPTFSVTASGGTWPIGTYYAGVTYTDGTNETIAVLSAAISVTVANSQITVIGGAVPANLNALTANVYVTPFTITSTPAGSQPPPLVLAGSYSGATTQLAVTGPPPSPYTYAPQASVYQFPSEVIEPVSDPMIGNRILLPKSTEWLNYNLPAWKTSSGTPYYYCRDGVGLYKLILAPNPDATVVGLYPFMLIYCEVEPPTLVIGTALQTPDYYYRGLVYYVVATALYKAGQRRNQALGDNYLQKFESFVQDFADMVNSGFQHTHLEIINDTF